MGFQVYRSREVESDELNFELLNMPPHHPARDMWDTFFTTTPGAVLRTHTSPGQIHAMRAHAPNPVRAILPGMCYRNEAISTRSEIQFYQVEGLVIGEGVTMADLKGTITAFARRKTRSRKCIHSTYRRRAAPAMPIRKSWPGSHFPTGHRFRQRNSPNIATACMDAHCSCAATSARPHATPATAITLQARPASRR